MVINKEEYKKLIKDGGGKFKSIACVSVNVESAPIEFRKDSLVNLYVMKNGLFGSAILEDKFYIKFENIKNVNIERGSLILEVIEIEDILDKYIFYSKSQLQLKNVCIALRKLANIEDEKQIKEEKFLEKLKKEMENNIQTEEKRAVMSKRQIEKERLAELKANKIPFCPKCHSISLHYIEKRKRFSLSRTVVGGAVGSLVNPIGTAVGAAMGGLTSNKQKKGEVKCLNCGYKWKL